MTPREGKVCRWCGYPLTPSDDGLCATCRDWIEATGTAITAAGYAAREHDKEQQRKWQERRK